MKKNDILLALSLFIGTTVSAYASSWYGTTAGNDETLYYFDADTVEKNREITTIWVKVVQVNQPDSDGSWATAARWRLDCSKRTLQSLAWSTYDAEGKFIKSNSSPGAEKLVLPDSTGEAILKIACAPDFPKNKSEKDYWRLGSNDVFQATRNFANYLKSKKDSAPQ